MYGTVYAIDKAIFFCYSITFSRSLRPDGLDAVLRKIGGIYVHRHDRSHSLQPHERLCAVHCGGRPGSGEFALRRCGALASHRHELLLPAWHPLVLHDRAREAVRKPDLRGDGGGVSGKADRRDRLGRDPPPDPEGAADAVVFLSAIFSLAMRCPRKRIKRFGQPRNHNDPSQQAWVNTKAGLLKPVFVFLKNSRDNRAKLYILCQVRRR